MRMRKTCAREVFLLHRHQTDVRRSFEPPLRFQQSLSTSRNPQGEVGGHPHGQQTAPESPCKTVPHQRSRGTRSSASAASHDPRPPGNDRVADLAVHAGNAQGTPHRWARLELTGAQVFDLAIVVQCAQGNRPNSDPFVINIVIEVAHGYPGARYSAKQPSRQPGAAGNLVWSVYRTCHYSQLAQIQLLLSSSLHIVQSQCR